MFFITVLFIGVHQLSDSIKFPAHSLHSVWVNVLGMCLCVYVDVGGY